MTKYKFSTKFLFIVGLIQSAVTAVLGIQASGNTGIVVDPGSLLSMGIVMVTVVGSMTNFITSNAVPVESDGPIL